MVMPARFCPNIIKAAAEGVPRYGEDQEGHAVGPEDTERNAAILPRCASTELVTVVIVTKMLLINIGTAGQEDSSGEIGDYLRRRSNVLCENIEVISVV